MFEIIKEAGLKLPKSIGSAITIVGALILGDIAVSAGRMVPSVIMDCIDGCCQLGDNESEQIHNFLSNSAASYGRLQWECGLSTGLLIMLTQIISNQSFGIPLLSSFNKVNKKDNMLRFPLSLIKKIDNSGE